MLVEFNGKVEKNNSREAAEETPKDVGPQRADCVHVSPSRGSSGVAESRKKILRSFFDATNSNCASLCDGVRL
ncbi:uncharacterized protein TrAtP1_002190 [Trichoderma atroviride]|uniref:uncharacterized protein n=1 Tax=Hypocrea atroviridis TaxID=63577 RepID=UPI00332300B3|nr:hypothetical protein TrAtP1_002190 [Trichoderma atroviride]